MFNIFNWFRRKKTMMEKISSLSSDQIEILRLLSSGPKTFEEICDSLQDNTSSQNYDPHQTALVECPICTRQWTAVWATNLTEIECPTCSNMIEPIIISTT